MKREEEIMQEANTLYSVSHPFIDIAKESFIEGANWADKHPKRYNQDELCDIQLEMMKQRDKRLINKACEWLKDNIDFEHNYPNSKEELINDFKKAMER